MQDQVDTNSLDALKEIIGEDLKEILQHFIDTSAETVQQIKDAITVQDTDALQLHAHTLKGSSANIGAIKLPELSLVLENKGKEGIIKTEASELEAIEKELNEVNKFLESYMETI